MNPHLDVLDLPTANSQPATQRPSAKTHRRGSQGRLKTLFYFLLLLFPAILCVFPAPLRRVFNPLPGFPWIFLLEPFHPLRRISFLGEPMKAALLTLAALSLCARVLPPEGQKPFVSGGQIALE